MALGSLSDLGSIPPSALLGHPLSVNPIPESEITASASIVIPVRRGVVVWLDGAPAAAAAPGLASVVCIVDPVLVLALQVRIHGGEGPDVARRRSSAGPAGTIDVKAAHAGVQSGWAGTDFTILAAALDAFVAVLIEVGEVLPQLFVCRGNYIAVLYGREFGS